MCAHPIIGPNLLFWSYLLAMTKLDFRNDWACRLNLGIVGQHFLKGMWENYQGLSFTIIFEITVIQYVFKQI